MEVRKSSHHFKAHSRCDNHVASHTNQINARRSQLVNHPDVCTLIVCGMLSYRWTPSSTESWVPELFYNKSDAREQWLWRTSQPFGPTAWKETRIVNHGYKSWTELESQRMSSSQLRLLGKQSFGGTAPLPVILSASVTHKLSYDSKSSSSALRKRIISLHCITCICVDVAKSIPFVCGNCTLFSIRPTRPFQWTSRLEVKSPIGKKIHHCFSHSWQARQKESPEADRSFCQRKLQGKMLMPPCGGRLFRLAINQTIVDCSLWKPKSDGT